MVQTYCLDETDRSAASGVSNFRKNKIIWNVQFSNFPNDADGDGGAPTIFPSGQTPGPSRPGTKYPVRGQSLTSIFFFSHARLVLWGFAPTVATRLFGRGIYFLDNRQSYQCSPNQFANIRLRTSIMWTARQSYVIRTCPKLSHTSFENVILAVQSQSLEC